jgi:hypothetical protein
MKYSIDKQEHYAIMTLEEENLNSLLAPDLKSELVIFKNEVPIWLSTFRK